MQTDINNINIDIIVLIRRIISLNGFCKIVFERNFIVRHWIVVADIGDVDLFWFYSHPGVAI